MELGLSLEMEMSGRVFAFSYYVELGGVWWTNVLNLSLLPQRHRPDTWPEHHNPVSPTAQKKREREREREREKEKERKRESY